MHTCTFIRLIMVFDYFARLSYILNKQKITLLKILLEISGATVKRLWQNR